VPRLSDQTQHSKPIVGLPTQIANDKGRLSFPTVVEGLGSCPETGLWEVVRSLQATPLKLALMLVGAAPVTLTPDADAPASTQAPDSGLKEIVG
jgi:hypothetical protein